jgi:hypothetical protein
MDIINEPLDRRIQVPNEPTWGFDDAGPTYYLNTPLVKYGSYEKVDPFPCYSHPLELVTKTAREVETTWPLPIKPYYFLLSHEVTSRTNGSCGAHTIKYAEKDGDEAVEVEFIVLSGKRIPLMPTMTRYLVAHEYGHAVNNFINRKQKSHNRFPSAFEKDYALRRGGDTNYGSQKWHTNTREIIANDFRICVCGIEREFWPHTVPHPDLDLNIQNYWYELMLNYL